MARFSSVAQLSAAVTTREQTDKTVKMTLTGGVAGQSDQAFNGVGVLRLDENGTSMQFAEQLQRQGAAPAEVTLVVQPGALLLRPPADAVLPAHKSWLQLGSYPGYPFYRRFLLMAAALRSYADPQAFFAQYGDAITITHATDEPRGGVGAVRYDLHVTPPAGQAGADYSIWLDEDNHPVRTLIDEPIPGGLGRYTLDSTYTGWGRPVHIGPPEPTQVSQQ